jgi:hypothetical protein
MSCRRLLLALCLLAAGCSGAPEGSGDLLLGWTFSDGRRCANSGVERVVVHQPPDGPPLLDRFCSEGFGTCAARLTLPAGPWTLRAEGRSASGTPLYRATFTAEPEPGRTTPVMLELAFVGGL